MWRDWLDLIYPRFCRVCGRCLNGGDNLFLCFSCWRSLPLVRAGICLRCGTPRGDEEHVRGCCACGARKFRFDEIRVCGKYQESLREMLVALKFHGKIALRYPLARLLAWQLRRHPFSRPPDFVVPVPVSSRTLATRGYNQAEQLATLLAKEMGIAFLPEALHKMRHTAPQSSLDPKHRKTNVNRAFAVPESARKKLAGRTVLLVDDILTTGSTADECADALKKAGAASVCVAAVGRAMLE